MPSTGVAHGADGINPLLGAGLAAGAAALIAGKKLRANDAEHGSSFTVPNRLP